MATVPEGFQSTNNEGMGKMGWGNLKEIPQCMWSIRRFRWLRSLSPSLWRARGGKSITFLGVLLLSLTWGLPKAPEYSKSFEWSWTLQLKDTVEWLWTLQLEGKVLADGDSDAVYELVNRMRFDTPPETWRESALRVGGLELRERDLRGANLRRTKLPNAILADVDLRGADLTEAKLPWTKLEEVNMQETTLSGTVLYEAKLSDVDLTGSEAENIDLRGAKIIDVILVNAKWNKARLDDARLDSVDATDIDLTRASLRNTDLAGARLDGALLTNATMQGAILDGASLEKADLNLAKMPGAVLSRANLKGAYLNGADLRGAALRAAIFGDDTEFQRADLTGTDLRETTLRLADLEEAKLGLADLRGVDLRAPLPISLKRTTLESRPGTWDNIQETPCRSRAGNKQDQSCLDQWKARIPPDQPCLMTKAWGPCLGEQDLEKYDEHLAGFLTDLACENQSIARAVVKRIELAGKETSERPLVDLLAKRLHVRKCPVLSELSTKIEGAFEGR
uniref:Uncharacterized protein YjbI, contains pentapeptide repeats n=1 Tax=Candidatus Kentrum sp. LFY TaxID=2126342 RepID=A0A450UUL8_9GAMM|nr:MAG: Uncharacterized protein YjbI, contains pentapeptide repeats [Candidatus Kentron sp. LFY]